MRNLKVASAIAAVLASSAGVAAQVDVYISGASAQKNFWYSDLANLANCPTSSLVGAKWGGPATSPAFSKAGDSLSCSVRRAPVIPSMQPLAPP